MAIQQYGLPEPAKTTILPGPLNESLVLPAGTYKITSQVSAKVNGEDIVPGGVVKNFPSGITSIFANSPNLTPEQDGGTAMMFRDDETAIFHIGSSIQVRDNDTTLLSSITSGLGGTSSLDRSDSGLSTHGGQNYAPGDGQNARNIRWGAANKAGDTVSASESGSRNNSQNYNRVTPGANSVVYQLNSSWLKKDFSGSSTSVSPASISGTLYYRNGNFILTNYGSSEISVSADEGDTWTTKSTPREYKNIVFQNNLYFASVDDGTAGILPVSSDLDTWTEIDVSDLIGSDVVNRTEKFVSYVNGEYIVPFDGYFIYSSDGTNWAKQIFDECEPYNKFLYVNGLYYTFGANIGYGWSADKENWTYVSYNTATSGIDADVYPHDVDATSTLIAGTAGKIFTLDTTSGKSWFEFTPVQGA